MSIGLILGILGALSASHQIGIVGFQPSQNAGLASHVDSGNHLGVSSKHDLTFIQPVKAVEKLERKREGEEGFIGAVVENGLNREQWSAFQHEIAGTARLDDVAANPSGRVSHALINAISNLNLASRQHGIHNLARAMIYQRDANFLRDSPHPGAIIGNINLDRPFKFERRSRQPAGVVNLGFAGKGGAPRKERGGYSREKRKNANNGLNNHGFGLVESQHSYVFGGVRRTSLLDEIILLEAMLLACFGTGIALYRSFPISSEQPQMLWIAVAATGAIISFLLLKPLIYGWVWLPWL